MEDCLNDPTFIGLLMLLVTIGLAGVAFTLLYKPKCRKHGTVMEEEPVFTEGMGAYDGSYGVHRYCVQCREEARNVDNAAHTSQV